MKRPAFQFYPGDWLRDTALLSCSVGARGLWMHMICLMHEGSPYGHLKVGNKVIHSENLARMVGASLSEVEGWLDELRSAEVYSVSDDGCIFSRRMVRDEKVRAARAAGGSKGGNPALLGAKDKRKDAQKVNLADNLEITPASSSSSSSADLNINTPFIPPSNDLRTETPPRTAASKKTKQRLPDDFAVTDEMIEWAKNKAPAIDPVTETEAFVDYQHSNATTAADWIAAWRNWMRKAQKFSQQRSPPAYGGKAQVVSLHGGFDQRDYGKSGLL